MLPRKVIKIKYHYYCVVYGAYIMSFCVNSHIKTVHTLALEYLVAFYPICLILITYICMTTTSDQLFGQETISQTPCLLQEGMELQSINNQCFHNTFASRILQNPICILQIIVHFPSPLQLWYYIFQASVLCIMTQQQNAMHWTISYLQQWLFVCQ